MRPTRRSTNAWFLLALGALLLGPGVQPVPAGAQERSAAARQEPAIQTLMRALNAWKDLVEPNEIAVPPRKLSGTVSLAKADGLPGELRGAEVQFALQAPDRLSIVAKVDGKQLRAGRNGQQAWAASGGKDGNGFAVVGKQGVPRFKAFPNELDDTVLGPLVLPVSREQLSLVPLLVLAKSLPEETVGDQKCHVLGLTLTGAAAELIGADVARWRATFWTLSSALGANPHVIAGRGSTSLDSVKSI